jgi:hypothetical protein
MTTGKTNTHRILPKTPSKYQFLDEITPKTDLSTVKPKVLAQHLFPHRKQRVEIQFQTFPFPHNEKVPIDLPDEHLESLKRQSTRRREAYPRTRQVILREGSLPNILDPEYEQRPLLPRINGKLAIPLPSTLQRQIGISQYTDLVQQTTQPEKPKSSRLQREKSFHSVQKSNSLLSLDEPIYFQHVKQPDFSDFDQMMIQKPVIIYMQKKREKP